MYDIFYLIKYSSKTRRKHIKTFANPPRESKYTQIIYKQLNDIVDTFTSSQ